MGRLIHRLYTTVYPMFSFYYLESLRRIVHSTMMLWRCGMSQFCHTNSYLIQQNYFSTWESKVNYIFCLLKKKLNFVSFDWSCTTVCTSVLSNDFSLIFRLWRTILSAHWYKWEFEESVYTMRKHNNWQYSLTRRLLLFRVCWKCVILLLIIYALCFTITLFDLSHLIA